MSDHRIAWLIRISGPLAGARYLLRGPVTRVGRGPENDIVVDESPVVSSGHLEIRQHGEALRLYDLNSTNGTYLNGERVREAELARSCTIQLGINGPELAFEVSVIPAGTGPGQTVVVAPVSPPTQPERTARVHPRHEELLSRAVTQARLARRFGAANQTANLMREVLHAALRRTARRHKAVIVVLILLLAAVSGYGLWRIQGLKQEKLAIDGQIQQLEKQLQNSGTGSPETEQLVDRLNQYQSRAQAVSGNLFYRVGVWQREDFVEREVRALMAEFGAETYSLPPEFLEQVRRSMERYQGPDRPLMILALGQARGEMQTMRRVFQQNNLPPDLAYTVLVESALVRDDTSPAGAVGLWQFTPATARAYGLRVTRRVDERLDAQKSTQAACRYLRELILDFGSGTSVMLALAAYNVGPTRVKQEIHRVSDPIKQRNFWYLYRVRALPEETREYVPKVIAAMIIGRSPERFGF
jgi:soluble lytic murein transglycosylase-like protein